MRLLGCIAIAAALLLSGQKAIAQRAEVEFLSAPTLTTGGDRVVAFDLTASDCSIGSLPNIPRGWFLSITNDASGTVEVRGNAQVGAASLSAGFFRAFVGVQRQSPETPISHLTLEIVVTKDFTHERHIVVSTGDLTLSKSPE
jgi:hypothetical protein